jgi:DNA-binding response OmpR family regulator
MTSNLNEQQAQRGEILLVDDNPTNLALLSEILQAQNYHVRFANSGLRALTAIEAAPPDIVLLDIMMPNMDGYEVCRRLKANLNSQHIPVIFISANDATFDKVRAFAVGGSDYITKPFHVEEVLARIDCQLKIARLSRELQLQVLRYQLNPHFLFNALMSIRSISDSMPVKNLLTQLSEYLRYLLLNRNSMQIELAEELTALRNYLAIEQLRFEDTLSIEINTDISQDCLVPAMIIQPILENAIKYGMKTSTHPLRVEFTAQTANDRLILRVVNSGRWLPEAENNLPQSASLGIGLTNVRQRLRQCYPGDHSLKISEQDGKVVVEIDIPINGNAQL